MKENNNFEDVCHDWFEKQVESTDSSTLSKLNRARHKALESIDKKSNLKITKFILPVTSTAFIFFLSLNIMQFEENKENSLAFDAPVTDIEIILSEESLDMIEQIEFYSWLEEQNDIDLIQEYLQEVG